MAPEHLFSPRVEVLGKQRRGPQHTDALGMPKVVAHSMQFMDARKSLKASIATSRNAVVRVLLVENRAVLTGGSQVLHTRYDEFRNLGSVTTSDLVKPRTTTSEVRPRPITDNMIPYPKARGCHLSSKYTLRQVGQICIATRPWHPCHGRHEGQGHGELLLQHYIGAPVMQIA